MNKQNSRCMSFVLAVFVCMGFVLSAASLTVSAESIPSANTDWFSKDGSDLYIGDINELYGFASLVNAGNDFEGKTVHLLYDITVNTCDMSDTDLDTSSLTVWTPIGSTSSTPFKGTFDGYGHTVSGLYVKSNTNRVGFFGEIQGAEIKNLRIENSLFIGKGMVGSIAGYARKSGSVISNCFSSAEIKGMSGTAFGGIVGQSAADLTVSDCVFAGSVRAPKSIGGILGFADNSNSINVTLDKCINKGTISLNGDSNCGELIGSAENKVSITLSSSLSIGSVSDINGNTANTDSKCAEWIGCISASCSFTVNNCYTDGGQLLIGANETETDISTADVTFKTVFDEHVTLPLSVKLAAVTDTYNLVHTQTGASVKLSEPTGLRFTSSVNSAAYEYLKSIGAEFRFGTIITPTDYLERYNVKSPDGLIESGNISDNDDRYLHVEATAEAWFSNPEDQNGIYIAGTIASINPKNYEREFSAAAYCKITLNGEEIIYYSLNTASRSVSYVAKMAYDNGDYGTEEQKAILESFFNTRQGEQ